LLPHTQKVVLSDNGSEFEADFARLLEDQGIKRWYTYPKNPKMNAHAERFNRTIQESFVDYHEELLFTDLALSNCQSPLSFLLEHQPECQRYWTHTDDYDWAHLAMNYWPERVREKCKTDKSLAIAHGWSASMSDRRLSQKTRGKKKGE
jgi:transposase InsO family protein